MIPRFLFIRTVLVALLCAMTGAVSLAAPEEADKTRQAPHRVDVFRHGEGGYHTFRIPSLTAAPDGTPIAIAEGRRDRAHDPGGGTIHLVCKRSTDGGETWGSLRVLDDPGEKGAGASNPTAVVDRETGRLWVLYNRWASGVGTREAEPGTDGNQVWARWSDDAGRTWSEPIDLTRSARDYDAWGATVVGSGSGIQTREGRLLIPAAAKPGGGSDIKSVMRAFALYSDDHGETWRRGELLDAPTNEAQMVELHTGEVLIDARQSEGARRRLAESEDGGASWSEPRPGQAVTPVAASIARHPGGQGGDERTRLVWTGPKGPGRHNLVARLSYDEGLTWPIERPLSEKFAAYSDIAVRPDGTVCVLWEREDREDEPGGTVPKALTLSRFDLDWLEAGERDEDFRPLFNGRDLEGWERVTTHPSTWTVRDGMLICSGKPIGELRTDRMYQNFVLEMEWRHMKPKGNAGLFVWADALTAPGRPFHRSVEVQILDGRESDRYTSDGDVFPIQGATMTPFNDRGGSRAFPTEKRANPSPEWNHYRVTCVDGKVSLAVNGRVVTRGRDASPRKGYICLESEGGTVHYRNIRIRELPDTPVEPEHVARTDRGYEAVYLGIDFEPFELHPEARDHWEADDWQFVYDGWDGPAERRALATGRRFREVAVILDYHLPGGAKEDEPAPVTLRIGGEAIELPAEWSDAPYGSASWKRVEADLSGEKLTVTVNGELLLERDLEFEGGRPPERPIVIIPADRRVQFANLFVKPMP